MRRACVVLIAVGLSWGCHRGHRKKPKDGRLLLDPAAQMEDLAAPVAIDNACDHPVDLVVHTAATADDEAVRLTLQPDEGVAWSFEPDEKLWRGPATRYTAIIDVADDDPLVTLDCDP